jgi:hypothetical protein
MIFRNIEHKKILVIDIIVTHSIAQVIKSETLIILLFYGFINNFSN